MTKNRIIQFIHSGNYDKGRSTSGEFPWNTEKHKRKLVADKIAYVSNGKLLEHENGYLWCEWECGSSYKKQGKYTLNTIKYPSDIKVSAKKKCSSKCSKVGKPLNTDPYVFGDHFIYSNCMQATSDEFKKLEENDIILFGSHIGGNFVIDMVFVVERELKPHEMSSCFKKATYNLIKGTGTVLYKGKNYDPKKPDEIFSFFPCSTEPFDRPKIDLEYISKTKQGVYFIHNHFPFESKKVWNDIRKIIESNNLYLGVKAEEPKGL